MERIITKIGEQEEAEKQEQNITELKENPENIKAIRKSQKYKPENKKQKDEKKLIVKNCNSFYSINIDFDYEFDVCESCTIEFEVDTLAPISDNYYCNKLSAPCQNFIVVYNLSNNGYTLDGFPFSFLRDDYGDAAQIKKSPHSIVIKSSDWVMPGEGILISMKLDGKCINAEVPTNNNPSGEVNQ